MSDNNSLIEKKNRSIAWQKAITIFLLLACIAAGAYFRSINVDWDEGRHLHPDERFLSMVLNAISPVEKASDYFNTASSSLNPGNVGYDFFVYGTFPLFIIRYVGEWIGQTGYDPITIVGRQLSALADVATILLVFLIATRLYHSRLGLLAAAFYAFAVLPIQQSHFMTVDTFTNTFGMLTVYAAVLILTRPRPQLVDENGVKKKLPLSELAPYILFGIALGLATASKINAVSLALMLPIVELVCMLQAPESERDAYRRHSVLVIALAAFFSILFFRIGQPYAFDGPGFISLRLNSEWLSGLRSLRSQSAGQVDFPPALQWARRPASFSLQNLVRWGLGLPLGIAAVLSFIGMGWQILKTNELKHLPVWAWTGFYFLWQGLAWVKAMRYLLLIYPLLAIIAAWGVFRLWEARSDLRLGKLRIKPGFTKALGAVAIAVVLLGSGLYAFAFTRIYTQPHTRIAATNWIYENIPGPVNLLIETDDGTFMQQAPYRSGSSLRVDAPLALSFASTHSGELLGFTLPSVSILEGDLDTAAQFSATIVPMENPGAGDLGSASATPALSSGGLVQPFSLEFQFDSAYPLEAGSVYLLQIATVDPDAHLQLNGVPSLRIRSMEDAIVSQELGRFGQIITPSSSYQMDLSILQPGEIRAIELPYVLDQSQTPGEKTLRVSLALPGAAETQPVSGTVNDAFTALGTGKGTSITVGLDQPLPVSEYQMLTLSIELIAGEGQIAIASPAPVHESSWDDALPVSKAGYVPYSDNGGIFRGDLNLELYWPDDASKRERIISMLEQGDYVFISSNRQWGTTTRVPERYPLTSQYYLALLGCPEDTDLVTCYNVAEPGMFTSQIGFELVRTFTSYPRIGSWQLNDQFAEEAFSVYDHPKALIFRKTADFDSAKLREVLNTVDLSKVVNITARQADDYDPGLDTGSQLMLTETALEVQQSGGTWSELFDRSAAINQYPALAVVLFYLFSFMLGLLVFPITRLVLPGLADKGYPFSRLIGLLLLAYAAFVLGSNGTAITRSVLLGIVAGIAVLGLIAAILQRRQIVADLRENWKHYLLEEGLALLAFLFFLWVRQQNPDLWHPWKGGEKPMDFSYLNAVIKSSVFPAYDPWFAGGYINYYYYGFIIVGMPIKLLGIVPAVAYNIVLPLWYSILVAGAYSIGWNLTTKIGQHGAAQSDAPKKSLFGAPFWAGISTSALLAFLGNQGTIRLFAQTLRNMGAAGAVVDGASFFQRLGWFFKGLEHYLNKVPLPLYPGDWYWYPSRVIPGDPITEFPFFSFLYADLHAHLIAMPIVVLAVVWGMSFLFAKDQWRSGKRLAWIKAAIAIVVGSLIVGALKPTNTWDYYTLLALNLFVLAYVGWKYFKPLKVLPEKAWLGHLLTVLLLMASFFALSMLLYQPFSQFFKPGYSQIGLWSGDRTPLSSYFTHWSLLIFLVVFWYAWETYQWLAETPMRALRKLRPYKNVLIGAGVFFLLLLVVMLLGKITVALIVIPLCLWSLVLIMKADQSDVKRLAFFMIGTALLETLAVELVYLVGDIGRMNVVFKLYMQAWILLTLALGSGLILLWNDQVKWTLRTQLFFQVPVILLIAGALLFPLMGGIDKINDRMTLSAPQTLDGMAYMQSSAYFDMGVNMDLGEDYRAIQWMQENIQGSPVIVEGQAYEYRWGNRYTIYTGLPGVVGWNYHQRQQRAILRDNSVQERVDQVNEFYTSESIGYAKAFLKEYQAGYFVVGQLEQAFYPGAGLEKFAELTGILWDESYRDGSTVIYKVR